MSAKGGDSLTRHATWIAGASPVGRIRDHWGMPATLAAVSSGMYTAWKGELENISSAPSLVIPIVVDAPDRAGVAW